jgi:hypothetical protein
MIAGFEHHTEPLTDYERDVLLPVIVRGLRAKIGSGMAITNKEIQSKLEEIGYKKLSGPRVRKIINFIRIQGLIVNLIASSKGYYIETNIDERRKYVQGVKDRAQSMLASLKNIEV